jgi:hypothetical protein
MKILSLFILLSLAQQVNKPTILIDLTRSGITRTSLGVPGDTLSSAQATVLPLPLVVRTKSCIVLPDGNATVTLTLINNGESAYQLPQSSDQVAVQRSGYHERRILNIAVTVSKEGKIQYSKVVDALFSSREDRDSIVMLQPGSQIDIKLQLRKVDLRLQNGEQVGTAVQEISLREDSFTISNRSQLVMSENTINVMAAH